MKINKSDLSAIIIMAFFNIIFLFVSNSIVAIAPPNINLIIIALAFFASAVFLLCFFSIGFEKQTKIAIDGMQYSRLIYKNAVIFIDTDTEYAHVFNWGSGNVRKLHNIKYLEVIEIYNRNKKLVGKKINPYKYTDEV